MGFLTATLAVVTPTSQAAPVEGTGFSVDIVHTNPKASYSEGDRLTFKYVVTNKTTTARGIAITATSNLVDDQWCQWNNFGPGTLECNNPSRIYHDVTAADLAAGKFVPSATWNLHEGADRWVTPVAETLPVVGAEVVLAAATPTPTPTPEPTPTPTGTTEPGEPGEMEDYDLLRGLQPYFTEPIALATAGEQGFGNYRIVALATATNGDLLASYDGRPTGTDSPGPNSILQRRSTDNGKTWGPQTVVAAGKTSAPIHGYSDPSYVVDRDTGSIFIFHVYSLDVGFGNSQAGTDPTNRRVIHAAVSRSDDHGHTWTTEVITDQITPEASWTSRFATSGNGIQLKYGEHAGRLIQPYPVRVGSVIQAVTVYSDNHGETWQAGVPVGTAMDENVVVELSDGRVMLNSRDNARGGYRKVAYSTDGGRSFGAVTVDNELPDPANNASLIRAFPNAPQGSDDAKILLFSNAADQQNRINGTVRMSCDDGQTWPISRIFEPGAVSYTTLATQSDGTIGMMYEPNHGYTGIRYVNFPLSWLGEACVGLSAEGVEIAKGGTATVPVTITNTSDEDLSGTTVTATGPDGWTIAVAGVPNVPAGATGTFDVTINLPADAVAGPSVVQLQLDSDIGSSGGSVGVRVTPSAGQNVHVVATHTNPKQPGTYAPGDRLEFSFHVINVAGELIATIPSSTDLAGFDPTNGSPNCRYSELWPSQFFTCTSAFHVVTQADIDAGEFSATTRWEGRRGGNNGATMGSFEYVTPTVKLAADAVPTEVELPELVPTLTDWTAADGVYTLTDDVRLVATGEAADRAAILAEELAVISGGAAPIVDVAPAAGDVVLSIDATRAAELGAEGYELTIGETVEIVGATSQGVFYGTRTLAQMVMQTEHLPYGSAIDVPAYDERGITLCACQINISTDWIDRLLEEMSYLKLNYLLLELKVKTTDSWDETHTWSYYTKADIAELVEKADALGIEVIPEINSPGHMAIWLENLPELQLLGRNGIRDEVRLDITTEAAFEFYTDLIDEYMDVFTGQYWHMGADEYMIHSGFQNFPQIEAFAENELGHGAAGTPQDTFIWFVNRVNQYVKDEYGKTLRIWNDGLTGANVNEPVDTDIVVEHWQNIPAVNPQVLVNNGHKVMNASYHLYLVRGGLKMNTANLWNNNWTPGVFYGGGTLPVDHPNLTGAKISLWPDTASAQTENQVENEMFMPMRFISQITWAAEKPHGTYGAFEASSREVGRPLGWENIVRQPVSGGSYSIVTTDDESLGAEGTQWVLTPTSDGYYSLKSASLGQCLDIMNGQIRLGVPVGIGAVVGVKACATTGSAANIQKWQIKQADGGYEIINAASQQRLTVNEAGTPIQMPHDLTTTLWTLDSTLAVESVEVDPGSTVNVEVVVTNGSGAAWTGGNIALTLPEGWTGAPVPFASLAAGASQTFTIPVTVPENTFPGERSIPVTLTTDQGSYSAALVIKVANPDGDLLVVQATHTNPKELDTYQVGDRLNFTFQVANLAGRAVGIVPTGGLQGFDPNVGSPNCRFQTLATDGSYNCTTAYYVVTQADLDRGLFTPSTTWTVHDGNHLGPVLGQVILDAPQVGLTTSGVVPTDSPTPTPTDPTTPPAIPEVIPQPQISIHDYSSHQSEGEWPGVADMTLDGDIGTIWHNEWVITAGPHHLTFDLGDVYELSTFIHTPRQSASVNGVLKDYEIYVSEDPDNFGDPVLTGSIEYTKDDTYFPLDGAVGRYVKVVWLDSYNDNDTMVNGTLAEANFVGIKYVESTPEPTPTDTDDPTSEPTDTDEPTAGPTETVTETAPTTTATATSTATETAPTVTASATQTASPGVTHTATVRPTTTVTVGTPGQSDGLTVYNTPGFHFVNDRHWHTVCEPYSQTTRCRTDIWATTVKLVDGEYKQVTDWVFNNLTYLPSARELWVDNPLGHPANWTDESGRGWYTECDTVQTGRNGCRTYAQVHLVVADGKGGFTTKQEYVFNNMVLFS